MINISDTPDTLDQEAFRLLFPLHLAIKELQTEVTSTPAEVTPTLGGTNSQQVYTYIAGEDIEAGKLVALSNSSLYLASRSKGIQCMGVAVTSGTKGSEVNVLMLGFITLQTSIPATAKYLYLGESGAMTSSPAQSGQLHQQVATVTGDSVIHFFPLMSIRRR